VTLVAVLYMCQHVWKYFQSLDVPVNDTVGFGCWTTSIFTMWSVFQVFVAACVVV